MKATKAELVLLNEMIQLWEKQQEKLVELNKKGITLDTVNFQETENLDFGCPVCDSRSKYICADKDGSVSTFGCYAVDVTNSGLDCLFVRFYGKRCIDTKEYDISELQSITNEGILDEGLTTINNLKKIRHSIMVDGFIRE